MSVCAWCRQEGVPSVQFDQVGTHNARRGFTPPGRPLVNWHRFATPRHNLALYTLNERRGFTPPGLQARLEPKNASPT